MRRNAALKKALKNKSTYCGFKKKSGPFVKSKDGLTWLQQHGKD